MGDDRNSILALARHLGLLQGLVRIPVGLFGELLGVLAGFSRIHIRDQVRKFFITDLNAPRGVARLLFGFRGNGHDFLAGPEDFLAGFGHDLHGFHPRHFLGGAGIDADHFGVRVRREHHLAVEHVGAIHVVAVLDAARRLPGAVKARNAPANQAAFVGGRPVIVSHQARPPFIDAAASTTASRTPI